MAAVVVVVTAVEAAEIRLVPQTPLSVLAFRAVNAEKCP
jgi:hypothetical protein